MAVIQQFRTAVGGFNRQDVQDYIEQMAAAHRREQAQLQERLEQSDRRIQELEEQAPALAAAREELAKVQVERDAANQTVSRLRGELSQADAKLSVAKKEGERLQARVAALEPQAAGYQGLRDRVASVELDAHQKSQTLVNEARAEAERVRADTRRWLSQVMEEYSALRCGLDGVLGQLQALADLREKASALDETARTLRERGGLK